MTEVRLCGEWSRDAAAWSPALRALGLGRTSPADTVTRSLEGSSPDRRERLKATGLGSSVTGPQGAGRISALPQTGPSASPRPLPASRSVHLLSIGRRSPPSTAAAQLRADVPTASPRGPPAPDLLTETSR